MTNETRKSPQPAGASKPKAGADAREDRLKAALKANLARRKAQAKARAADTGPGEDGTSGTDA